MTARNRKRVAILQSNYIPWKGYFDIIGNVDAFLLFDDVQFTKNDWRNRNQIKTDSGLKWLSIPVRYKGLNLTVDQVEVVDQKWRRKHWNTIEQFYRRTSCFDQYASCFEKLYLDSDETSLTRINETFIREICGVLGIQTEIRRSTEFTQVSGKTERLVDICQKSGASVYVSGPAARDYLEVGRFEAAGISVEWMDYSGYPEYPQSGAAFEHGVSVLDLIFNTGSEAGKYMKGAREQGTRGAAKAMNCRGSDRSG